MIMRKPFTKAVPISETIAIGGENPLALIAGPCVIEDEELTLRIAREIKAIAEDRGVKMPSFFGYMAWSCGILVPLFLIMTLIWFR